MSDFGSGANQGAGGERFITIQGSILTTGISEYPLEPVPIIALIGALASFFLIRRIR